MNPKVISASRYLAITQSDAHSIMIPQPKNED